MNCQSIRAKHPGYIPAIIKCDASIEMTKKRFLLPESENFGHALQSIRRYVKVKPSEAIFFMIDGMMLKTSDNIGNFYSQYVANRRTDDGFLIIDIFKENTFGVTLK
jgi:predicted AlkP superfamily pyrophosphatase or phosphodiesterase